MIEKLFEAESENNEISVYFFINLQGCITIFKIYNFQRDPLFSIKLIIYIFFWNLD